MKKVVTKFLDWVSILVKPVIRVALNRLHAKGLLRAKISPVHDETGSVIGYDFKLVYFDKDEEILFDSSTNTNSQRR